MEVEQENFGRRLEGLLPLLEKETDPDNYEDVRPPLRSSSSAAAWSRDTDDGSFFVSQIAEEEEEKGADRLLFTFLTLISKLCKHCGMLELREPRETLCKIWGKDITHVHMWKFRAQ